MSMNTIPEKIPGIKTYMDLCVPPFEKKGGGSQTSASLFSASCHNNNNKSQIPERFWSFLLSRLINPPGYRSTF